MKNIRLNQEETRELMIMGCVEIYRGDITFYLQLDQDTGEVDVTPMLPTYQVKIALLDTPITKRGE